jgi:hypothetical protein
MRETALTARKKGEEEVSEMRTDEDEGERDGPLRLAQGGQGVVERRSEHPDRSWRRSEVEAKWREEEERNRRELRSRVDLA